MNSKLPHLRDENKAESAGGAEDNEDGDNDETRVLLVA